MSLLSDVRSRGHWILRVHPTVELQPRLEGLAAIERTFRQSVVKVRGWDFPHVDPHAAFQRDNAHIQQESAWNHHLEVWRASLSGQVFVCRGVSEDWRDRSQLWPLQPGEPRRKILNLEGAVFQMVEFALFASRWMLGTGIEGPWRVVIELVDLPDRMLVAGANRWLDENKASAPTFRHEDITTAASVAANPAEFVVTPTRRLIELFGIDVGEDVVRSIQKELRL